jgi:hypothetical protein
MLVCGGVSNAQSINVNVQASQQPFSRGVFGHNIHASPYYSEGYGTAYDKHQELLEGTSERGPAGGMRADSYDWRIREDAFGALPLPGGGTARSESTLDYLRHARDRNSLPIVTVNEHGLGYVSNGNVIYTDTATSTLTTMASDWVRYTNRIVQIYRQGDVITDTEDLRVLNSLSWGGPDYTSNLLLAPGEAAVPKVNYWEIGNEVNFRADEGDTGDLYRTRYHDITTAMRSQDATIKTGPNITGRFQSAESSSKDYIKALLKPVSNQWEQVDFISYHPYDVMVTLDPENHTNAETSLKNLWSRQNSMRNWTKDQINQNFGSFFSPKYYPTRNSVELLATEWNPSVYDTVYAKRQWNALGVVDTAMNFAQNGLKAANFWLWPANIYNGNELPMYKAFEALTEYGGDTLVSSYQSPGGNSNARLYITQDSETGTITVWGMNFLFGDAGDQAITLEMSLNNLGIDPGQITLMRLADLTGPTTLFSSGTGTQQTWTSNVDWITTDMTGMNLQDFDFTINPAELSLLVIQPGFEPGDFNGDGIVNVLDIDMLAEAIRNGGPTNPYDLNGVGGVNLADLEYHVEDIIGSLMGDTDVDGDVDLSDLSALASYYGNSLPQSWGHGDFDCDEDVDLNDLSTLAANYSGGQAAAFAAFSELQVPEPGLLAANALCATSLILRPRRRV